MQPETHAADRLVFRAITAPNSVFAPNAQELPTLDLIGAAIARAARLAANDHRARAPRLALAQTHAAGLLKANRRDQDAVFTDLLTNLNEGEGRVIPLEGVSGGFLWRFHPAPHDAGARIASDSSAHSNAATTGASA